MCGFIGHRGDNDLLSLNPFRGVAIITPQEFLSELAGPV